MDSGGYDENFVEDSPEIFKCIICHLVLRDPVFFTECSHRVCGTCFKQMKDHAGKGKVLCPHDRMQIDEHKVVEDRATARAILDLKVTCNSSSKGCNWVGELRHLKAHTSETCQLNTCWENSKCIEMLMKKMEDYETALFKKDEKLAKLETRLSKKDEELRRHESLIISLQKQVSDLAKKGPLENRRYSELPGTGSGDGCPEITDEFPAYRRKFLITPSSISNDHALGDLRYLMNVDEYVPNKHTVFNWIIKDFSLKRERGNNLFSPRFYGRPNGHSCRLQLQWFGKKRGGIILLFHAAKGCKYPEMTPFDMTVTLKSFDVDGRRRAETITKEEILKQDVLQNIEEEAGYGILKLPASSKHIIDDTLTITCVLSHD